MLDLSHWPGNATPAKYKADTSTESALRFAEEGAEPLALVVNNHFDVDGALSVFALLSPEVAMQHRALLIAAAEVGDFEEWPQAEDGVRLALAVSALADGLDEQAAYDRVLPLLPALLSQLADRADLWGSRLASLHADVERTKGGGVTVERVGPIAVISHASGQTELDAVAVHRVLPAHTNRLLWAFAHPAQRFAYRYELPRYCWADTVVRPVLPRPGKNALVSPLPGSWALKGEGLGMTGLARTKEPLAVDPAELAALILAREKELGTL